MTGETPARGARGEQGPPGRDSMTPGTRRAVVFLFALAFAIGGLNFLWTARQVGDLQDALTASCKFDSDLGAAPVIVTPPARKPGLLGVTIISDAREAWHGLGCPGELAPPGAGFVKWATFYHLPVS